MQLFSHPIKSFCWLCIFLLLTSMLSSARGVVPQDQERMLAKLSNRNEPLRIKAIKGKKGAINVGKKFLDDDDWLKGLSFKVENISEKNIIHIELELDFPKAKDDQPPLLFSIEYGLMPLLDGTLAANAPPPIKPGEEIELSLSDSEHATLRKLLEELGYPKSIKQAVFSVGKVIFDDLLMWQTGRLMRRDPNDPRRWIPLNRLTKTSPLPDLNFIGTRYLNLSANFLLSDSSKNFGTGDHQNGMSMRCSYQERIEKL